MEAVLQADVTGTPAAVDFNPDDDLVYNFAVAEMSSGNIMWLMADLEPGTYVLACFMFAKADETSHALHGMYLITDVEETAKGLGNPIRPLPWNTTTGEIAISPVVVSVCAGR